MRKIMGLVFEKRKLKLKFSFFPLAFPQSSQILQITIRAVSNDSNDASEVNGRGCYSVAIFLSFDGGICAASLLTATRLASA